MSVSNMTHAPKHLHYSKGYTLIETVVALAIIVGALVGPVSLIVRGIYDFSYSKNKIIGINLAQEGLELVRLIRENNELCLANGAAPRNWKTDYDGSGNLMTGVSRPIDATSFINLSCGTITISNPTMTGSCNSPLLIDANGNYGYIIGSPTPFSRCIDINSPGGPENGPGGLVIGVPAMMDVTSTVTWSERGNPRTVTLTTRLYNWK